MVDENMDNNSTRRHEDLLALTVNEQKINIGTISRLHECSSSVTPVINFDGISATDDEINNLDKNFSRTSESKRNTKCFPDAFIAIQGKEKEVEFSFLENLREFLSKIIETFTSGNTLKVLEHKHTLDSFLSRCVNFIMNTENYIETTDDDNSKINFYFVAVLVLVSQKLVKNKGKSCFETPQNLSSLKSILNYSLKTISVILSSETIIIEQLKQLLQISNNCMNDLQAVLNYSDSAVKEKDSLSKFVEQRSLLLSIYNTEVNFYWKTNSVVHDKAYALFQQVKNKMSNFPVQQRYLTLLCYNIGLKNFNQKEYEEAIFWLKESFELGKSENSVGKDQQSNTLKLMVEAYLLWDTKQYWQKALHTLELAHTELADPEIEFKRLQIIVHSNNEYVVSEALHAVQKLPHLETKKTVELSHFLLNHGYLGLAVNILEHQFGRAEEVNDKAELLVLLTKFYFFQRDTEKAALCGTQFLKLVESKKIQLNFIQDFFCVMTENASKRFKKCDYIGAIKWHEFVLKVYDELEDVNKTQAVMQALLKVLQSFAFCCIELKETKKAKSLLSEAKNIDPANLVNVYLHLKLAILEEDDKAVQEALASFEKKDNAGGSKEKDNVFSVLCHVCRLARNIGKSTFAIEVFKNILACSTITPSNASLHFCVMKCLTCFYLEEYENGSHFYKDILSCVNKAGLFLAIQKDQNNSVDIQEESCWYMKVCWNLALQSDVPSDVMFDFFTQCCHFLSICNTDNNAASQIRYKTSLLMAAASGINAANQENNSKIRKTIIRLLIISRFLFAPSLIPDASFTYYLLLIISRNLFIFLILLFI
ncbi:testis-expressed protein 11-like isoform X2 [Tachypleus tridentatus]|uniref:testis-expressed protein 11-like isoform X2 n=1 Tax=Tachypleus tridentatus TaxID=6853 RepID=UPI003FD120D2